MAGLDTSENLTPFRIADDAGRVLEGAILFDAARLRQAEPGWFDPAWWGERAQPVGSGGRGGAWFVDTAADASAAEFTENVPSNAPPNAPSNAASKPAAKAAATPIPFGPAVLRHYLRGGMAARFSRDRFWWRGPSRIRSFDEFRLLRELRAKGLPVPLPIAAVYWRSGGFYRAAILLDRLQNVRALADLAADDADAAIWPRAGELIARMHRAGLDHADLNAHNLLFDAGGRGWVIDLDRGRIRIPATAWREANLQRLERSLLKLRGARSEERVREDVRRLREAYDTRWRRGI
ncbi:MAG: 3-deoxy-D-manno-octulosonic acid kinase [Lysobacter sp.]|nr:3-deoxy-D-manno-octulosonic acid kinase [Lysobacter sp.]